MKVTIVATRKPSMKVATTIATSSERLVAYEETPRDLPPEVRSLTGAMKDMDSTVGLRIGDGCCGGISGERMGGGDAARDMPVLRSKFMAEEKEQ